MPFGEMLQNILKTARHSFQNNSILNFKNLPRSSRKSLSITEINVLMSSCCIYLHRLYIWQSRGKNYSDSFIFKSG